MTIAITGDWGTGKSSLLRLVGLELSNQGHRPVQFNAWHCEPSGNMAVALLQSIREQAVPPMRSWPGVMFRLRLLGARSLWYWASVSVLVFLLAMFTGYLTVASASVPWMYVLGLERNIILTDRSVHALREAHAREAVLTYALALRGSTFSSEQALLRTFDAHIETPLGYEEMTDILRAADHLPPAGVIPDIPVNRTNLSTTVGGTLLGLFLLLLRGMQAFGVNFSEIAQNGLRFFRTGPAGSAHGRDAQDRTRAAYRHEFELVTASLAPRWPVILIDDIDRCHPETAVGLLETIHFLTSAGRCYVVIAYSPAMLHRMITSVHHELVTAFERTSHEEGEDARSPESKAGEFARLYLQKLINVEILVPDPAPSALLSQLDSSVPLADDCARGTTQAASPGRRQVDVRVHSTSLVTDRRPRRPACAPSCGDGRRMCGRRLSPRSGTSRPGRVPATRFPGGVDNSSGFRQGSRRAPLG